MGTRAGRAPWRARLLHALHPPEEFPRRHCASDLLYWAQIASLQADVVPWSDCRARLRLAWLSGGPTCSGGSDEQGLKRRVHLLGRALAGNLARELQVAFLRDGLAASLYGY